LEVALSRDLKGGIPFKSREILWSLVIVLYCINFLNVGIYIPFLLLPHLLIYVFKNRFSKVFFGTLSLLTLFSIVFTVSNYHYGFIENKVVLAIRLFYPVCLFILGYKLINKDFDYQKTYRYLFLIIISFTMFGFLSLMNTIFTFGNIQVASEVLKGRMVISIWGDQLISATGLNTFLSIGLFLLPIIFLTDSTLKHIKAVKIISIICFVASVYCVFQLGNRTGLGIIVASFIVITLYKKPNVIRFVKWTCFTFLLLFFRILFDQNFLGMRQAWENTFMYSRFHENDLTEDPRYEAWNSAFWGLFEHPLGGRKTEIPLSYAHNMWLDVGYDSGILPFVLLIAFTLLSMLSLITFIKVKRPMILRCLIIGLYTAFFITFAAEPILQGWFTYFTIFCFILGIIQRLNSNYFQAKIKD
jgi:hypothetical protein